MDSLSLLELNSLVRRSLEQCLPDEYWIQAELSDVRSNTTEALSQRPEIGEVIVSVFSISWGVPAKTTSPPRRPAFGPISMT